MRTFNSCSHNYRITSYSSKWVTWNSLKHFIFLQSSKKNPKGIPRASFVPPENKWFEFVTKRLLVKITSHLLTKISEKSGTSKESFCHPARELSLPKKVKRFADTMKNENWGVDKTHTHTQKFQFYFLIKDAWGISYLFENLQRVTRKQLTRPLSGVHAFHHFVRAHAASERPAPAIIGLDRAKAEHSIVSIVICNVS